MALPPDADGPDELGSTLLVDGHHGQSGSDRDDRLGLFRRVLAADGAHQGRRDQVDPLDGQSGPLHGLDHAVDEIDVGRGHQNPAHLVAVR